MLGGNGRAGEILSPDKAVTSPNGRYTLIYQADANLVIYRPDGTPIWATDTVQT